MVNFLNLALIIWLGSVYQARGVRESGLKLDLDRKRLASSTAVIFGLLGSLSWLFLLRAGTVPNNNCEFKDLSYKSVPGTHQRSLRVLEATAKRALRRCPIRAADF